MYLVPQDRDVVSIAVDISSASQQIVANFLGSKDNECLSQSRDLINWSILISPDFQLLPWILVGKLKCVADDWDAWWAWEGNALWSGSPESAPEEIGED